MDDGTSNTFVLWCALLLPINESYLLICRRIGATCISAYSSSSKAVQGISCQRNNMPRLHGGKEVYGGFTSGADASDSDAVRKRRTSEYVALT
jgi:hypothetical protein